MIPEKMTRQELHKLSKEIDRLDTQIGLSAETIKDVRNRISHALRRADK